MFLISSNDGARSASDAGNLRSFSPVLDVVVEYALDIRARLSCVDEDEDDLD